MKASDIQLLLIVRGLYREGYKTITIKELLWRCNQEDTIHWNHRLRGVGGPAAKWFTDALDARRFLNIRPGHEVWDWSDRLRKAVRRVAKTGRIKVDGKMFKHGYSINSTIHLWDYTIKQMFGNLAFQFVVQHQV